MARVSLLEAYDNKDVVQQIYRLMEEMDGGTIQDFEASKDSETGIITIKVTMNDDTVKEYSIPSVDGVTLDTAQTVSGVKVFSAASGNQFSGDLDVGGDFSVNGDTVLGDEMEVAGAAFERSGNDLVVSPTARLLVKTGGGANQELVVGTDSVIADKILESTTPTASSDVKTVTNIEYCAKTDGTNNLVHTNGNEEIDGLKTFTVPALNIPRNVFGCLGWTHLFDFVSTSINVSMLITAGGTLILLNTFYNGGYITAIGRSDRSYSGSLKIAHNSTTGTYEVWFNAAYGSWGRGTILSIGSGNSVGSLSSITIVNTRGSEPVVGSTYDTVVEGTSAGVVS